MIIGLKHRELFRGCCPGCSDCLFEVDNLRMARVYTGLAAFVAQRISVVPF